MKVEMKSGVKRLVLTSICVGFALIVLACLSQAQAATVVLPSGSITTTDFYAWSTNTKTYGIAFDFSAGPTTIQMNGLDMNDILYKGTWAWPPVTGDYGAQARFGISG
jgi:hypothetical protein